MSISRRTLLRGATATVALPFLASAPGRKSWGEASSSPRRMLFYYVPNGIQVEWFTPDKQGERYDLKDITAPLEPVQQHVSLLSGLNNVQAEDVVAGDHARGTGSFLTCVPIRRTSGADIENGISVDQVAANAKGHESLFPSLQVGIQAGGNTGDCTAGYSCAYTRNISWAGPTTPMPNISSPRLLFERMFGVPSTLDPATRQLRALSRASVLDQVLEETRRLQTHLGQTDKTKLDQYLTAVREVEVRSSALGGGACTERDPPPTDFSYPEHVALMQDLMVVALQCDMTRILTFMLGEAASNQAYDFIGVSGAHHAISHHQDQAQALEDLVKIGNWEVGQLAALVAKLAETPDGEGSLLDSTLVYWSSEIQDGNQHTHRNLPVLLAGAWGGLHKPGRHVAYPGGRPIADLYLWMLQGFGVEATRFGADGHTPLDGLAG
jgi:hypothetical protein